MLCYREVPKPVVTIVATDNVATEGDTSDTGIFTVTRSNADISQALTVYYSTAGSTASSYSDYNALSGSVIIPANSDSATITVVAKNNTLVEADETVKLTVSSNSGYTVGTPSSAVVYIWDDEYTDYP